MVQIILYLKYVKFASLANIHCLCKDGTDLIRGEASDNLGVIATLVSCPRATEKP